MFTLRQYLGEVSKAVTYHSGNDLATLISISIEFDRLKERASFPSLTKFDLQVIPDTKWQNLIETYLKLLRALCRGDVQESFVVDVQLLEALNRCAEKQDNWVLPALYNVEKELRALYEAKQSQKPDQYSALPKNLNYFDLHDVSTGGHSNSLESMARVISTSFQLCLNDRNLELSKSKRQGVYFFIGELFKIYSSLLKYDLARSTEKLFSSLSHELPQIEEVPKSHAVTYLYFSGSISCAENDLSSANEKLTKALQFCSSKKQISQKTSILLLLVPIRFLETRQMPSEKLWNEYPIISLVYKNLFVAIKKGDLKLFDSEFQKIEQTMLKRQLYLVVMRIRTFVMLKLFKKAWLALDQKHHIPISVFQLALEFSTSHVSSNEGDFKYSLDAAESQVARLIASGYMKGYLSHGNRIAVLSKQDPFPEAIV